MASSASVAVLKQGKAEGSPWPSGIVGLGSFTLRFSLNESRTPRTVNPDEVVSALLP